MTLRTGRSGSPELGRLAADIARPLHAAGVRDVRTDTTTRAAYSTDASLYRVVPAAVVLPRDVDEVAATLRVCADNGIPLTVRGAGTSIAGNAVGTGVVLDMSRRLDRILHVDPDARTATVEPGVVQQSLQVATAPHGLRFGPDPSTSSRCTIGGMIGNNSCGSRSLGYGRTVDNVAALRVLTVDGTERVLTAGRPPTPDPLVDRLTTIAAGARDTIRDEFGRFGRQVSGYALDRLLPEHHCDIAGLLVGSEGTLAVLLDATVRLVAQPRHTLLVALGYPDMPAAAEAVPALLTCRPVACEALDSRIVDVVTARRGAAAVPPLPAGRAWLLVELAGDDPTELRDRATRVRAVAGALDAAEVPDPARAAALWQIRADGAGLSGRSPAGKPAYAGWEDAAVPPDRLAGYLRDFDALMAQHDVTGVPYGHFGDGCLHIRIDWPLDRPGGRAGYRAFVEQAAHLVARHGGSLSGEHGDGRARSALLPAMYSASALDAMRAVKTAFDPGGILNPGVLVDPAAVDDDLRATAPPIALPAPAFRLGGDRGDLALAIGRCTGVGSCRAAPGAHRVMCPSYRATREERDSTRGRSRVLQEMVDGRLVRGGWDSPEVAEALDLCLSCKGCLSDCPTGVDMATLKSEALYRRFRRRPRPPTHYSLGRLPVWAALGSRWARPINALTRRRPAARALGAVAGIDRRRAIPPLAERSLRDRFADRPSPAGSPVALFVDTFTNYFTPEVGIATVEVLEAAGFAPQLTPRDACCALTWISTGQLDTARRRLARTIEALTPMVDAGLPIVGIEPSCTATLRSDAEEVVGPSARPVAAAVRTLAELLRDAEWQPPDLTGVDVVAQPHCHHHAVLGWDADADLLARAGAAVRRVGGCCGLAGNFGVERGHYEVSVAVAEQHLLPAIADDDRAVVLADGYSCRTQLADLTDRRGLHLAQLLRSAGVDGERTR
ncbi:FAD-binding and (Fe-S)-binding domain-containing protein [Millisia brevis]|uniref:FAD-binding and (Fe-S)-binding domain-containing protein n=1 Tax=Millisia brevis TaxID=264148 RepID=UPI0008335C8E|nr:FAD-binding and (Fe-S)-binding domain-containing protein [Millisia brevis]